MTVRAHADTVPRVYVASLSDYNGGKLHGVWINLAERDIEEVWEIVNAMLAASPEFREFPEGGPAEEWAIHDFEGFGGYRVSEYESLGKLTALAHAIEEHGEEFLAFLSITDEVDDVDDTVREFEDRRCGAWDSLKDYVESTAHDIGLGGVPPGSLTFERGFDRVEVNVIEALESYIDWDKVAREREVEGYSAVTVEPSYTTYIFGPNY